MKRARFTCSPSDRFWIWGLVCLLAGLLFGAAAVLQYLLPSFGRDAFSFARTRPLHVFLVVQWIFCGGIGGVYTWLQDQESWKRRPYLLACSGMHFWIHVVSSIVIGCFLAAGRFGGREYLEYPPALGVGLVISWALFAFVFFRGAGSPSAWPIQGWMFATGIVAFLVSFAESFLWLVPWIGDTVVRDLTVQWKSLGSMVGSWNMLVYGTAFVVMERIDGNTRRGYDRDVFLVFLLGFLNLLFNWGHHIYPLPVAETLRTIAYVISMTELVLLARIIWNFNHAIRDARSRWDEPARRWLLSSDLWILLNLVLAIILSIPSANAFTHGTHITVAHAMGATIGINTNILFAMLALRLRAANHGRQVQSGSGRDLWLMQICLLFFWISLLVLGFVRMSVSPNEQVFAGLQTRIYPWYWSFGITGIGLAVVILSLAAGFLQQLWKRRDRPDPDPLSADFTRIE